MLELVKSFVVSIYTAVSATASPFLLLFYEHVGSSPGVLKVPLERVRQDFGHL